LLVSSERTNEGRRRVESSPAGFRPFFRRPASKIVSKNHGYESTLKGVEESLEKMGLGEFESPLYCTFGEAWKEGADPRLLSSFSDYIDLFLIHDPVGSSRRCFCTTSQPSASRKNPRLISFFSFVENGKNSFLAPENESKLIALWSRR